MLYSLVSLLLLLSPASAFAATGRPLATPRHNALRMADDVNLDNPFLVAINGLQEAMQTSNVAKFKAKFAKLQAGKYDEVAVNAKLDQLMAEPAIMFSFTT